MKKLLSILIVCLIIVSYPIYKIVAKEGASELEWIITNLASETIIFKEWSLYASENMETNRAIKEFEKITLHQSDWSIKKENEALLNRWSATLLGPVYEENVLLVFNEEQKQAYLCYTIISNKNFDEIGIFLPVLEEQIMSHFSNNTMLFSYVKGHYINEGISYLEEDMNHFLMRLQAEKVESLFEDNFASVSAYSKEIETSVPTYNNKINLQVGLRLEQTNKKWVTHFIVGTPIITIEY